jgi:hypothetical protein
MPAKMEIMSWPHFQQEMTPYLPEEVSSRLSEKWYEQMKTSVYGTVSDWLEKALAAANAPVDEATDQK